MGVTEWVGAEEMRGYNRDLQEKTCLGGGQGGLGPGKLLVLARSEQTGLDPLATEM